MNKNFIYTISLNILLLTHILSNDACAVLEDILPEGQTKTALKQCAPKQLELVELLTKESISKEFQNKIYATRVQRAFRQHGQVQSLESVAVELPRYFFHLMDTKSRFSMSNPDQYATTALCFAIIQTRDCGILPVLEAQVLQHINTVAVDTGGLSTPYQRKLQELGYKN